ncbi:hypothetical protein [Endozoicomonas sp.]|uniref:hypothetical protein n=1 Tax=Endozoicomonas sp. TaxID=1892382 RepID=UPI0028846119|nr:hypothetical protein [Endozoicomonas sp.]
MLIACRRASLLLSGFLISGAVTAALAEESMQPNGYWVLENKDSEKPCGGLTLNRSKTFSLLVFDSNCQLYRAEGEIRQKQGAWELKNHADHSNVFILTEDAQRLKLVDTEGQVMLFTSASEAELEEELRTAKQQKCLL